jgi:glutamate synthase domain-containing protein 2
VVFAGFTVLGTRDLIQTRHAVLRNYPISAHLRFLVEQIRPEMRQYFFEDEKDGRPFSRDKRAVVYQRAKMVLDKRPFGTLCARVRVGPPFDDAAAARNRAVPRQYCRTGLREALWRRRPAIRLTRR